MCDILLTMLLSCIAIAETIPVNKFADIESRAELSSKLLGNIISNEYTSLNPLKEKKYRRISEEKCEEYAKNIVWILPLSMHSRPIPISMNCTVASINPLITGGEVAERGQFPHMAAVGWILRNKTIGYYCGGSLVSDQWVLTAAHCTHQSTRGSPSVVRIGANRLSDKSSGEIVKIETIKRHPAYVGTSNYADLALLKLTKAVSFTPNVKPACLDSQFHKAPPQAWVAGWGSTKFRGQPSDLLLKAKLDIVDNVRCALLHNFTNSVPSGVVPSMLCAGDPDGGWKKDTCQGDSGGPLQTVHPDFKCMDNLIGVTSFGRLCATPDRPGVYTRVSHYLDWIESIVWPE